MFNFDDDENDDGIEFYWGYSESMRHFEINIRCKEGYELTQDGLIDMLQQLAEAAKDQKDEMFQKIYCTSYGDH